MSPDERRQQIVSLIEGGEPAGPAELAARFGVSEDSIRRDLRILAERGLVRRVHGGALPRSPSAIPFEERVGQDALAKRKIAASVAEMLMGWRTICLDGGTTVLEVARLLSPEFAGTIVTVSLPVAAELVHRPKAQVIQVGGLICAFSQTVKGPEVVDTLRKYWFDACVLGVCSLDPDAGLTVTERDEAYIKGVMVERSLKVVAVASRFKLGTAEPFVVGSASAVGLLVTDAEPDDPIIIALKQRGIEVVTVPGQLV